MKNGLKKKMEEAEKAADAADEHAKKVEAAEK